MDFINARFLSNKQKVRDVMNCKSAPPVVGFRGNLVRRHEALSPWSLTRTVTSLHRKGMSWTEVYWFLWGLTQPLACLECRYGFGGQSHGDYGV